MAKFNTDSAKSAKSSAEKAESSFFDQSDSAEGFEQMNQSTMAIPFVRLLQKLSPQLDKHKPEFIPGAEEGMFFNTITKEVYGPAFNCVVGKFDRIFIEWRPDRGGFVTYHTPENAERVAVDKTFGDWRTADGNSLQENYVYMILIEEHENDGICVLSLSSSMIKPAREWNRLLTTHILPNGQRALPYYLVWHVESELQKNDKGTWYRPKMRFERLIKEQEYTAIKAERKALPSRTINYAQLEGNSEEQEQDHGF